MTLPDSTLVGLNWKLSLHVGYNALSHENISESIFTGWSKLSTPLTGKQPNLNVQQERPLGQRKTPPANKLPFVTSRVMSNTTRKYIYSIPLLYHSLSELPWLWLFKVTQGQIWRWHWTPHVFSYWWLRVTLWDIRLWNPSDLDLNLSRSFKVKCHGVTGLAIYGFTLMVNSNIGSNSPPLRDIRLWNLRTVTLTFQCHSRSSAMVSLDSPYMLLIDA